MASGRATIVINVRGNMKRLVILSMLMLAGCNTYRKVFDPSSTPPVNTPITVVVTGTTVSDHDTVDIRCLDSNVSVQVMANGAWVTLNPYEYTVTTVGAGGGGVTFGRVEYPTFNANGDLVSL